MRIDKYLTKTGLGSKKEVKNIIKKKLIYVDGEQIKSDSFSVTEKSNVYYLNNGKLEKLIYEEYIYLMLHKPKGYVCAKQDNLHKTVLELIKGYDERDLHIVGRLDVDTEGLLLITDDGNFTHQVTSPKSDISKTYYVEFSGSLDKEAKQKVLDGILLDDAEVTKPGILEIINESSSYITITEGKFHQVKRMFAALGTKVTYLKREKINDLELDIPIGTFRKLSNDDLCKIIKK